jgi:D-aminopeptidase
MGGGLDDGSGDIFLAFATGNRGLPSAVLEGDVPQTVPVRMLPNERMSPLFHAAAEATEAAILNALLSATTVTGRDGVTAHGLEPDVLLAAIEEIRAGGRS